MMQNTNRLYMLDISLIHGSGYFIDSNDWTDVTYDDESYMVYNGNDCVIIIPRHNLGLLRMVKINENN